MNPKMRGDAVDDFRDSSKDVRIMLVSLKAGNAGLNLNCASHVVILDPFWNPYIEGMLFSGNCKPEVLHELTFYAEQAIDRAHRLGQVRKLI